MMDRCRKGWGYYCVEARSLYTQLLLCFAGAYNFIHMPFKILHDNYM